MIKDITIGQYIPGESFIHKLDPRTKILISFLFIISLFIVDKFVGYIFVVAFLALVVYIAKISPRYLYKGLKPVFLLIALTAKLNIFMLRDGRLIFHLGFIKIYESGIRTAFFYGNKINTSYNGNFSFNINNISYRINRWNREVVKTNWKRNCT